jgi:hypothetical protein
MSSDKARQYFEFVLCLSMLLSLVSVSGCDDPEALARERKEDAERNRLVERERYLKSGGCTFETIEADFQDRFRRFVAFCRRVNGVPNELMWNPEYRNEVPETLAQQLGSRDPRSHFECDWYQDHTRRPEWGLEALSELPSRSDYARVPLTSTILYTNSGAWLIQLLSDGQVVSCDRRAALEFLHCRFETDPYRPRVELRCVAETLVPVEQKLPAGWELQPFWTNFLRTFKRPSERASDL